MRTAVNSGLRPRSSARIEQRFPKTHTKKSRPSGRPGNLKADSTGTDDQSVAQTSRKITAAAQLIRTLRAGGMSLRQAKRWVAKIDAAAKRVDCALARSVALKMIAVNAVKAMPKYARVSS